MEGESRKLMVPIAPDKVCDSLLQSTENDGDQYVGSRPLCIPIAQTPRPEFQVCIQQRPLRFRTVSMSLGPGRK